MENLRLFWSNSEIIMLTGGDDAAGKPVVRAQALQKMRQAFEFLVTQCEISVVGFGKG